MQPLRSYPRDTQHIAESKPPSYSTPQEKPQHAKSLHLHLVKQERHRDGKILQISFQRYEGRKIRVLGEEPHGRKGGLSPHRAHHGAGAKNYALEWVHAHAIQ